MSLLRDCPQLKQIGSARIALGLRMFSSARSRESALVPDFAFLGPEDDDATGHESAQDPAAPRIGLVSDQELRPPRKYQDRPVTPEVAGSSPGASIKVLQIGMFCCLRRRKPSSASKHPAHIPHGNPILAGRADAEWNPQRRTWA